jgi:hypothetical protein
MYTGIPENRFFVIIIKYISADRNTIPPVIIIPGVRIIVSWFNNNITGHELITVSESGYINKGIYIAWLDHFIKYYNYITNKNSDWYILLINRTICHEAPDFIIKAKIYKI